MLLEPFLEWIEILLWKKILSFHFCYIFNRYRQDKIWLKVYLLKFYVFHVFFEITCHCDVRTKKEKKLGRQGRKERGSSVKQKYFNSLFLFLVYNWIFTCKSFIHLWKGSMWCGYALSFVYSDLYPLTRLLHKSWRESIEF